MSLPAVSCPCCNVQLPLEAWLAHTGTREAFLALAGLHPSMRLPMTALRYVGLFAPAKQTMRWERIADLLAEVRELISSGRVSWRHQDLPAPLDYWLAGMETLLAKTDLRRPLSNHNYLKAVVAGMSDQAEAGKEAKEEEGKQHQALARGQSEPISAGDTARGAAGAAGIKPGRAAMPESIRSQIRNFTGKKEAEHGHEH